MPAWYPLKFTTPTRQHLFGGKKIREVLGKSGLPDERIGETWEMTDVDGAVGTVTNGSLQGKTLRELTLQHPEEVVGKGWHGARFPILTKFIDGTGMLPVHLHGNDQTAAVRYGELNGKTEAWHILRAGEGATFLAGLKSGVTREVLRTALMREDYDSVLIRQPVATGDTVYVPAGTLHSFGPDTLIYEVEQTSDIQQHAMPELMDGTPLGREQWDKNIDDLMSQLLWSGSVAATKGNLHETEFASRTVCCTGPYFTLERVRMHRDCELTISGAVIATNLGAVCQIGGELLGRAETTLLPAALEQVVLPDESEMLLTYLPEASPTIS